MQSLDAGAAVGRSSWLVLACALCSCTVGGGGGHDGGSRDAQPADTGVDAGRGYLVFFDEGVDHGIRRSFESALEGEDPPPQIVYPEHGTLVPPNLRGVDIHFLGRVYDTFEISFAQGGAPSVVVYTQCRPVENGCVFQPWRAVWDALAERRFRGPFEIRIRGRRGDLDRVSAASEPVSLELSQEEIDAALYFWSLDPASIWRYDFALGRRSSERFLSSEGEGICIGCHALSQDGTRIAVGVADEGGFRARIYDAATRAQILPSEIEASFPAYGDSNDILVSGSLAPSDLVDRPLRILDGTDGTVLHDFGVVGLSADWSADGDRIVFDGPSGSAGGRDLQLIERADDGGWSAPIVLPTVDTENERAPAFAPDSDWIAYTARREGRSVIVAMRLADGHTALLARAGAGFDSTWARWNPRPYSQGGRRLFWLTFSSARSYGLVPASDRRQIWMTAFDPEADPADPSRPAFRFPAQSLAYANYLAEWTLEVPRQPCDDEAECPGGEFCEDGFCFPEGPE